MNEIRPGNKKGTTVGSKSAIATREMKDKWTTPERIDLVDKTLEELMTSEDPRIKAKAVELWFNKFFKSEEAELLSQSLQGQLDPAFIKANAARIAEKLKNI